MEHLYIVKIVRAPSSMDVGTIDQVALEEYKSLGKLDFSLNEDKVDEILGKDAYCGGDIPEELLLKIESSMDENVSPSYFWDELGYAESFKKKMEELGVEAQIFTEEKSDWNESWRKSFQEIIVTDELKVVPSWEITEDTPQNIYIYPGMGFGTGNHETTFLCLKLYDEIKKELQEGGRVLDFGCGSGILGIAALKNHKAVVDFVDIDKDALDNCVVNLEHNSFQNYSEGHGVILRERFSVDRPYPLVFANILENILEEECEVLSEATEKQGYLIVSGLLKDQAQNIIETYNDFYYLKTMSKGDWVALLFKKK